MTFRSEFPQTISLVSFLNYPTLEPRKAMNLIYTSGVSGGLATWVTLTIVRRVQFLDRSTCFIVLFSFKWCTPYYTVSDSLYVYIITFRLYRFALF